MMKTIHVTEIEAAIAQLCIRANKELPADLAQCIRAAEETEQEGLPRDILGRLTENLHAAREMDIPICQDTGMAIVFADVGQDIHIAGGGFEDAVHRGVARGYQEGYLRCSIVRDPLRRENTGDNTPAVIHTRLVPGDALTLTVSPKGFGSENMSALQMMTPAAEREDIIGYVVEAVRAAGGNPCPPVVLGVGLGGSFESCALLAKRALCRAVAKRNPDPFYREMEEEILARVNRLNIGPQGFGGNCTALAVNIEAAPTHIAGLPVAVNVGCHVTRHAEIIL